MKKTRSQSSGRSSGARTSSASKGTKKTTSSGRSSTPSRSSSGRSGTTGRTAPRSASSSRSSAGSTSSRSSSNGRASTKSTRTGRESSPREDLQDVLKDGLKDIYYAEKQLARALGKMSRAATNKELRQAFEEHRTMTEEHVSRLEDAFEEMNVRATGKRCPAMDGLIEEASAHIKELRKGPGLDAALIVDAQKVEHYEIAAYGSLRSFAMCLGLRESEQIFRDILDQESETDELLTRVAQTVNLEALTGDNSPGATGAPGRMVRGAAARDEMELGEMEEEQM